MIHCAAYTAVDRAESEAEAAFADQRGGHAEHRRACRESGALAGDLRVRLRVRRDAGPPVPGRRPGRPLSVYGKSKLAAEEALRESGCDHLLVRTQWLYGPGGKNFILTILDKARRGETLKVASDQTGCPTFTKDLADAVLRLVEAGARGTVHFSNEGETTWFDLARFVLKGRSSPSATLLPAATRDLPYPAPRPAYSVLSKEKYRGITGESPRPWEDAVKEFLSIPFRREAERMKVLITGAAGFIGSNFVRYALKAHADWDVVVVDKLTYAGNLANLADVARDPRFRFHRADICDADAIGRIFAEEKPDAVINFAAETHVDRSIDDPSLFLRTNILGTQTLMDAARKIGVARYLQISTDEVYGSLGPTGKFSEESPLRPNSPYAASKTSADLLVRAYFKTYGLPTLVTRCSNNYGPYQFPEKLIPFFVTLLHEGKPVPVYGDGMNVRDWIHVDDHSRAVDAVLLRGRPGQVYNVGGGNERTNIEITKLLIEAMGKDASSMKFVSDRPGHDRRYAIDDTRIRTELGVVPQVPFKEGLEATVRWYLDNEAWWRAVRSGDYLTFYERWYAKAGR